MEYSLVFIINTRNMFSDLENILLFSYEKKKIPYSIYSIQITKFTILKLGRKEYLRKFYSFFFVRKIFILLLYFSNRRKKSWRGVMIYSFFL